MRKSALQSAKRRSIRKKEIISLERIQRDFESLGIEKGDSLFIHSSLSQIGNVENGTSTVIEAFKKLVGPQGTLIFPAFSFAGGGVYGTISNKTYVFDAEKESSYVGKISDDFRKGHDVKRSLHPTHSVAAWGEKAAYVVEEHAENGNWGKGTPFGKMLELNVKMIGLGVPLPKFTFFHCVEDYNLELFPGLYSSEKFLVKLQSGNEVKALNIAYHDPNTYQDRIEMNPSIASYFTNYFLESKKLKQGNVGDAPTLLIHAQDFYDLTLELARNNKTIYKI